MGMHKSGRNDIKTPGASVCTRWAHHIPGVTQDKTLADYIARKQGSPEKKKLSFDEWWSTVGVWSYGNYMEKQQAESVWQAAQDNV